MSIAPHPFEQLLELDRRSRSRAPAAAAAPAPGAMARLALRLDTWHLLLPLEEVAEVIPVPRITRVPGTKPWLLGIASLRGTIVSVSDLRAFLDGRPSTPTVASRVVVVGAGNGRHGLLVEEVIGMRHFGPSSRLADLEGLGAGLRRYVGEGFQGERHRWWQLNLGLLLKDPRFLDAAG